MSTSRTIIEAFGSRSRFAVTLVAAELNARTQWECDFTDQVRERFQQYHDRTIISPREKHTLHQLAGI